MDSLIKKYPLLMEKVPAFLLAGWTAIVVISAAITIYHGRKEIVREAAIEARTYFELNRSYRRWAAALGGVYAPVDKVEPNPYLMVPDRDVTTDGGRKLTLVNPAYMTSMVFDLVRKSSSEPVISKITSLKCINPKNSPDEWERAVLVSFDKGSKEAFEVTTIHEKPYLRLMKPFVTDTSCLKCHAVQGYQTGDIRGGISIAIPLRSYYENEAERRRIILATHIFIWLIGTAGIIYQSRKRRIQSEQLAESEWKFRTLSDSASDWEFWMDENGKLLYMSPSCREITGYDVAAFTSSPDLISELVHPEDREQWLNHLNDYQSEKHADMPFRITAKDGAVRWLSHVCAPIHIEGRFAGRKASNRDITSQRQLEDQLRQAQKMEAIGTLAGGIAHDFNNILTAIIGYGNLLQMKLMNDGVLKPHVDIILSSAEKASHLTHSLLAFSRKQVMNPKPVDLNSIVTDVDKLLRRLIGADIELKTHLTEEHLTIMGDAGQIEQILMNLATNARDAMPGGGSLALSTERIERYEQSDEAGSTQKTGNYALVTVSDTGKGMERLELEKIFEPFYTTKEAGKGTGLGLSMVYGIVKQHGGKINVYSEPGHGTVFRIYFPLVGTLQSETAATIDEKPRTGTETILIAEDNADVLKLVRTVLEGYGYKVISASDGEEVLSSFKIHKDELDLLILDVIMPKKSGKEAYDEIKEIRPGMKVLFTSGYSSDFIYKKGILEEGVPYLLKPVSPNELLRQVRVILDKQGLCIK